MSIAKLVAVGTIGDDQVEVRYARSGIETWPTGRRLFRRGYWTEDKKYKQLIHLGYSWLEVMDWVQVEGIDLQQAGGETTPEEQAGLGSEAELCDLLEDFSDPEEVDQMAEAMKKIL